MMLHTMVYRRRLDYGVLRRFGAVFYWGRQWFDDHQQLRIVTKRKGWRYDVCICRQQIICWKMQVQYVNISNDSC
jgi:hypothetical protein